MSDGRRLIIIRGPGPAREPLAGQIAAALSGPTAHIAGDDLGGRWLVRGLADRAREVDAVARILRLVVVSYLKEGYSVVVDAPFVVELEGGYQSRAAEITDLVRLAHTLPGPVRASVVTCEPETSEPATLRALFAPEIQPGEVRVPPLLGRDDARIAREVVARLGL